MAISLQCVDTQGLPRSQDRPPKRSIKTSSWIFQGQMGCYGTTFPSKWAFRHGYCHFRSSATATPILWCARWQIEFMDGIQERLRVARNPCRYSRGPVLSSVGSHPDLGFSIIRSTVPDPSYTTIDKIDGPIMREKGGPILHRPGVASIGGTPQAFPC